MFAFAEVGFEGGGGGELLGECDYGNAIEEDGDAGGFGEEGGELHGGGCIGGPWG